MNQINNDTEQLLPEPTLRRLPWYLAYVSTLRADGVEYVSSTRMAGDLGLDASRIAKDLSFINVKGKTRIGYEVSSLEEALRTFLGFSRVHNAIIAGAGSLGAALMRDSGLKNFGLNIVAAIDSASSLEGAEIGGVRVYMPAALPRLVRELGVTVGILAVPVEVAQSVADVMVTAGVTAIWNFTPTRIRVPQDAVITNTSIYSNLAVMYNRMDHLNRRSAE